LGSVYLSKDNRAYLHKKYFLKQFLNPEYEK